MILIIYRSQVCREIVLPNADNTDYRIFIDSKEFKLKKSFYLSLEVIAHKWSITNENGEYKIVKNQKAFEKTSLVEEILFLLSLPKRILFVALSLTPNPCLRHLKSILSETGLLRSAVRLTIPCNVHFLNLISKTPLQPQI